MKKELLDSAKAARRNSYAPYSGFFVGAALLAASGKVYSGCNVECAAYPDGMCAERSAFFKAVSEGEKKFTAIAVAGGNAELSEDFCIPCGSCLQVMSEFCSDDFKIYCENAEGETREFLLSELLPCRFELGGKE